MLQKPTILKGNVSPLQILYQRLGQASRFELLKRRAGRFLGGGSFAPAESAAD